jgi:ferritin-like metal-binding protein YciE
MRFRATARSRPGRKSLGLRRPFPLLEATLKEEKATDVALSALAKSLVNVPS